MSRRHRQEEDPYLVFGWIKDVCQRSLPLGKPFGVELHVLWIYFLVVPAAAYFLYRDLDTPVILVAVVAWTVLLGLVVFTHEMGHIKAARRYRMGASRISLSPIGGLAHVETPTPTVKAEIFVSLAGPAVHLVWVAIFWPLAHWLSAFQPSDSQWVVLGRSILHLLANLNLAMLLFNLLPIYPMDGGRVLRALLSTRMGPDKAKIRGAEVGMLFAILAGISITVWGGSGAFQFLSTFILLSFFLNCLTIVIEGEEKSRRRRRPRSNSDIDSADWWKSGTKAPILKFPSADRTTPEESEEGEQAEGDARALDVKVDAILLRINQVGMDGLTEKERQTLKRASKRPRVD